ncbi:phage tail spike protein [Streptococcus suis]
MIYLFDKDEKLIKIVRKSAVKTALQKYSLTTEHYVSDRLTAELKGLNADKLEQIEYMAIQTMEDAHTFHYFYVAQKSSDELTTLIGVQSGIEELRKSPVYDKRPQNTLARDVITDLLAGTNWQARFVGETTAHSTNFYYTSVFDALKKVCEVWDLEMQFFVEMNGNRIGARYIDFKQRIGEAVGKRVVYGHNALQILQEVERTNIYTALVGRGKGEESGDGYGRKITFENIVWSTAKGNPVDKPLGQKYLELPLMTGQYGIKNADGTMRPKIGFVDFSEEENPEVLIERTYRALVDAARPQLTLKTSSVYLKEVKVGDTIRVVRHDKKLDYDTRIFEITFNRLNNQSSDIKLGDQIGESNEAKAQTIADKAVEQFVNNEFSNFVQNLPDYLPTADGFNNNWYGTEDPTVKYPGKVLINDIWYKADPEHEGHKIMLRWTGEAWEEILRTYDSEALRDKITQEIAQVNQSMQAQSEEHDSQVASILSKTQSIESLANQAKTDATSAIARANQVKTDLQNQVDAVDAKAVKVQSDADALRTDLNQQAQTILSQAQAQTALTSRVTTVETLADGTKTTVAELSKTVDKATGDIASVTSRTKTVEDGLASVKTNYTQLNQTVDTQTGQIETINSKTADLQSGIDGVTERFENLQVGGENLINNTGKPFIMGYGITNTTWNPDTQRTRLDFTSSVNRAIYGEIFPQGGIFYEEQYFIVKRNQTYTQAIRVSTDATFLGQGSIYFSWWGPEVISGTATHRNRKAEIRKIADKEYLLWCTTTWNSPDIKLRPFDLFGLHTALDFRNTGTYIEFYKPKLETGNLPTDWRESNTDINNQIAEYKRTADQNYAGLQSTVSTLDGKVAQNKTEVNQTATQIRTEISNVEGKIPTETSGNLLLNSGVGWSNVHDKTYVLGEKLLNGRVYTIASRYWHTSGSTGHSFNIGDGSWRMLTYSGALDCWVCTFTVNADVPKGTAIRIGSEPVAGLGSSNWVTLVKGNIALSQWQPAGADLIGELSSVKTTINQTASGVEQLSTSLSTTDGKVTTAETKINQLISDVSSKVSQTDYNTLTGRVSSAETAITQNATEISKRLTSTQVEQAITDKGYATVTVLNNKAKETSDSFSRTISETKALIPTEMSGNLILGGNISWSSTSYLAKEYQLAEPLKEGNTYTLVMQWWREAGTSGNYVPMVYYNGSRLQLAAPFNTTQFQDSPTSLKYDGKINSWVVTFTVKSRNSMLAEQLSDFNKPNPTIRIYRYGSETANQNNNQSTAKTAASFATLVKGTIPLSRWEPSYAELATVTALHDVTDTVDSHTRTIGAVGTSGSILDNVSKVTQTANGLVTEVSGANGLKTQVSTLAGSYAIKNLTNSGTVLNQLNLNKDGSVRIDGKLVQITGTTYIEDGVIASAKIGSLDAGKITTGTLDAARIATNSITGSHIVFDQAFVNKMTANEALFKQLFAQSAFITSVQSTDISANLISGGVLKSTNGATNFDLNNGNLLFNNNYGYIRRTANDKIFEITTLLTEQSNNSAEYLSSKFMIRKSDSSRRSGVSFRLYTTLEGKPAATTQIYSDSFTITSSDNKILFSLGSKQSYLGTLNFHGWDDIPVATMSGGLAVKDIGISGHGESLLKVVERLCKKTGLIWT